MKIYTVTFNFTTNVGAALQEYALYKYLKELGNEVKVIDYRPKAMKERLYISKLIIKSKSLKLLLISPISCVSKYKFYRFSKKYIERTKRCNTFKDIENLPSSDCLICGSDQIWNKEITEGFDSGYFLKLNTPSKKISYAASCGQDTISQELAKEIYLNAEHLDAISVREDNFKEALSSVTKRSITQVLDPVFLLEGREYINMQKKPKIKDYILIYDLHEDEKAVNVAKKIAKEKGLKIIRMPRLRNKNGVDKTIAAVGPEEFIGLINNAEYVITNSFHGTVLSIILQKQFYCIPLPKRNFRIASTLNLFNLSNQFIYDESKFEHSHINYAEVNKIMNNEIKKSKAFIKAAIISEEK